MKLYAGDDSVLMEVSALKRVGNDLIVEGTIMGAMPIQAILRPAELRAGFRLLNLKSSISIIAMLFRK
jgi:hypothetical protein